MEPCLIENSNRAVVGSTQVDAASINRSLQYDSPLVPLSSSKKPKSKYSISNMAWKCSTCQKIGFQLPVGRNGETPRLRRKIGNT